LKSWQKHYLQCVFGILTSNTHSIWSPGNLHLCLIVAYTNKYKMLKEMSQGSMGILNRPV
jgi:hypothetical protein